MRTRADQEAIEAISVATGIQQLELREEWCWRELRYLYAERERLQEQKPRDKDKEEALKMKIADWEERRHRAHLAWAEVAISETVAERQQEQRQTQLFGGSNA